MSVLSLAALALAIAFALRRMDPRLDRAGLAPLTAMAGGILLSLTGRALLGLPIALVGLAIAFARNRSSGAGTSRVSTPWVEMRLDLSSGDLDGTIRRGAFAGKTLESLTTGELDHFVREVVESGDRQTRELVETYLDRRTPGWRDRADGDKGAGLGSAPGSGTMSEKEAYQILGLAPGASEAEIGEAHRRLMKRAHPDAGGSADQAALLNEAKSVLLGAHRGSFP